MAWYGGGNANLSVVDVTDSTYQTTNISNGNATAQHKSIPKIPYQC